MDNPLIFAETGEALSGGNFHAEPVAFAADMVALAVCEIGSISERRITLLVAPPLEAVRTLLRAEVPTLREARYLHPEIVHATRLVRDGVLARAAGVALPDVVG